MNKTLSSLALVAALLTSAAHAQSVTVKDPWVRATVAQQKASGLFAQISAAYTDIRQRFNAAA